MIVIRLYEPEDARELHEAAMESVAVMQPWMPWCHPGFTLVDAEAWIKAKIAEAEEKASFEFSIRRSDGRFLGGCGINTIDPEHQVANLGYWVRASSAGRGVAPAAVRKLAEWAFRHTSLRRLELLVSVDNVRSQRVAEKAGALREGVFRSRLLLHGQAHDAVVYSIIRTHVRPLNANRERALRT